MKQTLFLMLFCMVFSFSYAQKNFWKKTTEDTSRLLQKTQRTSQPSKFDIYHLDLQGFKNELLIAPKRGSNVNSNVIINFPNAEGQLESFRIVEASVLHPDLQVQFPDIKSYVGIGIEDKSAMIRFSVTRFGVHAMIFSGKREINYIDTYTKDLNQYIVYSRKNIQSNNDFNCLVAEDAVEKAVEEIHFSPKNSIESNTGLFRTYRLALACTVEYSAFHINQAGLSGAPLAQRQNAVLAAMAVSMTRVNGVYERDMSLTMEIIPENLAIIFINPELPDTLNNNSGGTLLNQIQAVVDAGVGFDNYDIGHVFSTGGGGVAQLRSPCSNTKARGVTGANAPVGDPFNIDYVAHEMGHQFGANHTQNNSCQRNGGTAVEPGSASTIMGYAGICNPNVQNNSDAHFHAVSLAEMDNFVAGNGNCSTNINSNNSAPVIQPIPNYIIPRSTAFILPGNATDADGDLLTYCWEQTNNEVAQQPPLPTNIAGPSFRSSPPQISPDRYMPLLSTVLTGATSNTWEVVPSVARTMNFALTVRDNQAINGGQTARANMTVTTSGTAGPFLVTSPNTNVSWVAGSNQNVTWDVAGTTANNVNTPYVDIFMSSNGGSTFPILLASQVPNDGSEIVTIPNLVGSSNRIMVRGHNNIFYDVSNANFSITAPASSMAIAFTGVEGEQNKSACQGQNMIYNLDYQTFGGFGANTTFSATGNPIGSNVTFVPETASAAGVIQMQVTTDLTTPVGFYAIAVTATSGAITKTVNMYLEIVSGNFTGVILSAPANEATVEPASVPFQWIADANATQYTIQIATDDSFLTIVDQAVVATNSYIASNLPNSTTLYWRVAPANAACVGNFSTSFSFNTIFCSTVPSANVPIVIPSTGTPTVNSTLTIPNESDVTIEKVTVTVDISHTWINDLIVTLISPSGTEIQLMNQECTSSTNFRNVTATFDDDGTVGVCSIIPNPALSGVILPQQPLSGFNGESSEGVWTLQVQDLFNQDGGVINSWSITICSANSPTNVDDYAGLGFSLFPNPNQGNFTIKLDDAVSNEVGVMVYDIRGRVIYDQTFANNGAFNQEIQLANPQAGIYLVKVTDGDQKEVKRLIIE